MLRETAGLIGVKISELPAANAADANDLIEVDQSGTSRSMTLAQVAEAVAPGWAFDVAAFGALGDGVTDDWAAIQAAMAAASDSGGGVVTFDPRTYVCRSVLIVPDGVALRGVAGLTKLVFQLDHFENGATSGLIRVYGSLGTPMLLNQRVVRVPRFPPRALSGTRSGTTATVAGDVPHDFQVGDPIWTTGRPSVAQGVFFTVNPAAHNVARTIPKIVTEIVDATTFRYAVDNTGDTVLDTVANPMYIYRAADVLIVPDTSTFTRLQDVMVRSSAFRTSHPGSSEQNHLGEFGKIARILGPTMLMLHTDVEDDYLTTAVTDAAEVVPVNFSRGFAFDGIELIGKGCNVAPSAYGDRGILMYLCDRPQVTRSKFTDVDQMGPYFWSCLNPAARDLHIQFDARDEAGEASGSLDIQYGVAYSHCTTGLDVAHCYVEGGRHACVQTGTSAASQSDGVRTFSGHGVSRHIHIHHNTFKGQWLGSVSTHVGSDNLTVDSNIMRGTQCGVNPRFCRHVVISDNNIDAYSLGIWAYNYIEDLTITGNSIKGGQYSVRIGPGIELDEDDDGSGGGPEAGINSAFKGPLKIVGNNCQGGEHGIYVVDATPGLVIQSIDVSGNSIGQTKYEGIRITIGDDTATADGWHGKVNDNVLTNVGQIGDYTGIWLTNMRSGQCGYNKLTGPQTLRQGIYGVGAGTGNGLQLMGNSAPAGLFTVRPIAFGNGSNHRTDWAPANLTSNNTVIVAGVATPILAMPFIVVDTEGGAPTDDLVTLAGGYIGQTVYLRHEFDIRAVTVKASGNIHTAGGVDRLLTGKTLVLLWSGSAWTELSFVTN